MVKHSSVTGVLELSVDCEQSRFGQSRLSSAGLETDTYARAFLFCARALFINLIDVCI